METASAQPEKIEINYLNGINTLPSYYASQLGPSLILALMISHKLIYDESGELSRIINTHTHTHTYVKGSTYSIFLYWS